MASVYHAVHVSIAVGFLYHTSKNTFTIKNNRVKFIELRTLFEGLLYNTAGGHDCPPACLYS